MVQGGARVDLYDRPRFVTPADAKLTSFFLPHLA